MKNFEKIRVFSGRRGGRRVGLGNSAKNHPLQLAHLGNGKFGLQLHHLVLSVSFAKKAAAFLENHAPVSHPAVCAAIPGFLLAAKWSGPGPGHDRHRSASGEPSCEAIAHQLLCFGRHGQRFCALLHQPHRVFLELFAENATFFPGTETILEDFTPHKS